MVYLFLLLAAALTAKRSDGSNIYMSWKPKTDELEINCTVSKLCFEVSIVGPSGHLEAYCSPPVHHSFCSSYNEKGQIEQNLVTNTTIYTLFDTDLSRYNGKWLCLHGRPNDKASIEVTLVKVVKYITSGQHCYEKFVTWTMIGLIPTFFIFRILFWSVSWISGVKVCRRILITLISSYFFLMPFIIGLLEKTKCKAPELFSLAGVICGLLINIVWSEDEQVNEVPNNSEHGIEMVPMVVL